MKTIIIADTIYNKAELKLQELFGHCNLKKVSNLEYQCCDFRYVLASETASSNVRGLRADKVFVGEDISIKFYQDLLMLVKYDHSKVVVV